MAKGAAALWACGQSLWVDNLRREWLDSGRLAQQVARGEVRGLTSNPTIFHKAIAQSAAYDQAMALHGRQGLDAVAIYEALVIEDIGRAADALRPVYEESGGVDGYVSVEVSPVHAHCPEATVAEAKALWSRIGRANVMVKVPGTAAGCRAVEDLVAAGLSVNVTLLFSADHYAAAAEAYVRGLERRLAADLPVAGIASVASVFMSRIDTAVDGLLSQRLIEGHRYSPDLRRLFGRAALAVAHEVYQRYKVLFSGERFARLAAKGAQVQRPLWASTQAKNVLFDPLHYVLPLVGADTVNTLPDATLAALMRYSGEIVARLDHEGDDSVDVLRRLDWYGVDVDAVAWQLQHEGVAAFVDSFRALLAVIEEKRRALVGVTALGLHAATAIAVAEVASHLPSYDAHYAFLRFYQGDWMLWPAQGCGHDPMNWSAVAELQVPVTAAATHLAGWDVDLAQGWVLSTPPLLGALEALFSLGQGVRPTLAATPDTCVADGAAGWVLLLEDVWDSEGIVGMGETLVAAGVAPGRIRVLAAEASALARWAQAQGIEVLALPVAQVPANLSFLAPGALAVAQWCGCPVASLREGFAAALRQAHPLLPLTSNLVARVAAVLALGAHAGTRRIGLHVSEPWDGIATLLQRLLAEVYDGIYAVVPCDRGDVADCGADALTLVVGDQVALADLHLPARDVAQVGEALLLLSMAALWSMSVPGLRPPRKA